MRHYKLAGLFLEIGVQTIDLLLLEFFVKRSVDAEGDADILMTHLIAGGENIDSGKVHQGTKGVPQLVRCKGFNAHGQAAWALFAFFAVLAVLCIQIGHVAAPQSFPCLLCHAVALYSMQYIQAIVLLSFEIVHKDLWNINDPDTGFCFGILDFFILEIITAVNGDRGFFQIDIGPSEGGSFAAAEA